MLLTQAKITIQHPSTAQPMLQGPLYSFLEYCDRRCILVGILADETSLCQPTLLRSLIATLDYATTAVRAATLEWDTIPGVFTPGRRALPVRRRRIGSARISGGR